MTAALVTGSLFRAPEQRTSKAGKPFVVATIKAKDGASRDGLGDAFQWWRVTAFSEHVQAELLRLGEGESVSVQGNFKAELYLHDDGETKLSLSIIADHVLAIRPPPKERVKKEEPPKTNPASADNRSKLQRCAGTWAPGGGPSDDIPF